MMLSAEAIPVLIYGALVVGGYVLRHVNVFRHGGGSPSSHPLLTRLLQRVDEEMHKGLDDAIKRMMGRPQ
jgi:hypothetical protein